MALNRADIFFKEVRNLNHYLRYGNNVSKHGFSVYSANKAPKKIENNDDPIKYSETKASKMTREEIFNPKDKTSALPMEKYVIFFSLVCFFTYFFLLRKGNKLDSVIQGDFQKSQNEVRLLNALLHAKIKGLKTDDIEQELEILKENK